MTIDDAKERGYRGLVRGDRIKIARSALAGPPGRRRITRCDLGRPQSYEVAALKWITTDLRAVFAAHVALEFMDGRCLRPADDVQRNSLMRIAAKTTNLEVEVAGVQGIPECRRGLRRSLVTQQRISMRRTRAGRRPCAPSRRAPKTDARAIPYSCGIKARPALTQIALQIGSGTPCGRC